MSLKNHVIMANQKIFTKTVMDIGEFISLLTISGADTKLL